MERKDVVLPNYGKGSKYNSNNPSRKKSKKEVKNNHRVTKFMSVGLTNNNVDIKLAISEEEYFCSDALVKPR